VSVTVKRTEGGYASNWLCDTAEAGARLRVLPPSGLFVPRSPEADLLLCAAGSGITPVMSILRSVLESVTGRVALFYANRDAASAIFADELAALSEAHGERLEIRHWHSATDGRVDAEGFARWAAPYREREIFTCGPAEFMDTVREGARIAGFDTVRIHTEEFRSLTGDPFEPIAEVSEDSLSDASLVDIDLDGEVHTLPWPGTHTLIDIMVVNGIDTPYACREGKCGACTCRLAEGEVAQGRTDALEAEDIADGYVLGCQATPVSKVVRVEF
jgi:3-ketosteroid 9alpha-monooxygenase subunit B